jgi:hypothetical protein
MQACTTTKIISNERILRDQLIGAHVDDVKNQLGEPNDVKEYDNRYVYSYYYDPANPKLPGDSTVINIDGEGYVKSLRSTRVEKKTVTSTGKTLGLVIPLAIVIVIVNLVGH